MRIGQGNKSVKICKRCEAAEMGIERASHCGNCVCCPTPDNKRDIVPQLIMIEVDTIGAPTTLGKFSFQSV